MAPECDLRGNGRGARLAMTRALLLTRPAPQSTQFWSAVDQHCPGKFAPVLTPMLEIRAEPATLDVSGAQALLFTSRNGVEQFAMRSDIRSVPALCVGHATAQVAQSHGFSASSAGGDVAALAALAAAAYVPDAGHFIHFRGAHGAGSLVNALLAEGIMAEERILYDQHSCPLTDDAKAALTRPDTVVLAFSPRTAAIFVTEYQALTANPPHVVAISTSAAAPFRTMAHASLHIATTPDAAAMLSSLAAL